MSTGIIIPVLAVTVFFLIRAEFADRRKHIYFLKPIATLLVISVVALAFFQPLLNVMFTTYVLVGLIFSLGGDMALMFPQNRKAFSLGLGLFLTAHMVYTIVFLRLGAFTIWSVIPIILILFIGVSFYRMIHLKLGSMKLPVMAYIMIISVMVVGAFSLLMNPDIGLTQGLMVLTGALLFYVSDLILAANRFWKEWQYNRISLAFYYSGQLLIALAASYSI